MYRDCNLENVSNVMTQYDGIIAYLPEIIQYNSRVVTISA